MEGSKQTYKYRYDIVSFIQCLCALPARLETDAGIETNKGARYVVDVRRKISILWCFLFLERIFSLTRLRRNCQRMRVLISHMDWVRLEGWAFQDDKVRKELSGKKDKRACRK